VPWQRRTPAQETRRAHPSWRIIADAEEFICRNKGLERAATIEFVVAHGGSLWHVKDLHTKVAIGGDKALVAPQTSRARG
jgi:hypothetical protein